MASSISGSDKRAPHRLYPVGSGCAVCAVCNACDAVQLLGCLIESFELVIRGSSASGIRLFLLLEISTNFALEQLPQAVILAILQLLQPGDLSVLLANLLFFAGDVLLEAYHHLAVVVFLLFYLL